MPEVEIVISERSLHSDKRPDRTEYGVAFKNVGEVEQAALTIPIMNDVEKPFVFL